MAGKSSFTTPVLEVKLRELNSTMQSIQGLSQWLIHHRKHCKTIVGVWYKDLQKSAASRKLTLLYLANDVIQNSKRKGPEFKNEFLKPLPRALQLIVKDKDESIIKSVGRVVSVWEERNVFDKEVIGKFKSILAGLSSSQKRSKSESAIMEIEAIPDKPPNDREPPEADELLKKMLEVDGDKSTVRDMPTRRKIASFPSEFYDADLLANITSKADGERMLGQVEEAVQILSEYTSRMEKEIEARKEIQELLDSFIWNQQKLLHGAKEKEAEYSAKMEKCGSVREILKSHIASLPNLATPSSEGLAPLPSAGDLFS